MKHQEKEPRQTNYLWVLAGVYLLYLAYQNAVTLIRGENSYSTALSIIVTVLFAAVGGWLILREWRVYRFGNTKGRRNAQEETESCAEDTDEEETGTEDTDEEETSTEEIEGDEHDGTADSGN